MKNDSENDKQKDNDLNEILNKKTNFIFNWGITVIFAIMCIVLAYFFLMK